MKKGIALVMLVVMIVVLAIIAGAVTIPVVNLIFTSDSVGFTKSMTTIEESVTKYYLTYGEFPIKDGASFITTTELLALAGDNSSQLADVIATKGDNNSKYILIDNTKLDIQTYPKYMNMDNTLYVNEQGTTVYYIKGYSINGKMHFCAEKDTSELPLYICGDVNSDGVVNQTDLDILSKYIDEVATKINLEVADVNGDGIINMDDVTVLDQYLQSYSTQLVCPDI